MKIALKTQLIAAIVIPLVFGAVIALVLTSRIVSSVEFYETLLEEELADERTARHMQATFKTQVQEWKDVLLRGRNPADLKKYWENFLWNESRVGEMAQRLFQNAGPELRPMVQKFSLAHGRIGVAYRNALETFEAGKGRDPYPADRAVRGIDREPAREIDAMVKHLEGEVKRGTEELKKGLAYERVFIFVSILLIFVYAGSALYIILRRIQKTEQELRGVQVLESLGRVAGGVAHHFNNLLMIISGNAELLTPLHPPGSPGHGPAQAIFDSGLRGGELTQELLAYSSRGRIWMEEVNLNSLVEGEKEQIGLLVGPGINVNFELERGLLVTHSDVRQLEQALRAIAANARDAMPDGGDLTVRTASVKVGGALAEKHTDARPGDYVQLEISDTGPGIPPEIIHHIFEPFFTTKEPGQGNGLGLSAVYGLARQSGGFVFAENKPDVGAKIAVFLPRYEGP